MKDSGPPLAPLLRRLADTPAEWMLPATTAAAEGVSSAALLSDFLEDLGLIPLNEKEVSAFDGAKADQRGWLALVLLALWLLHGDQLKAELSQRASPELRRSLLNLLGQPLRDRASVLNAQSAVRTTPDAKNLPASCWPRWGCAPRVKPWPRPRRGWRPAIRSSVRVWSKRPMRPRNVRASCARQWPARPPRRRR